MLVFRVVDRRAFKETVVDPCGPVHTIVCSKDKQLSKLYTFLEQHVINDNPFRDFTRLI